ELEDFAAHIDGDLAGEVAVSDGRGDLRDVADLVREVTGHGVHRVREVFPGATDPLHNGLAAELSFGTHFAGDTRDFRREGVELVDHRVDGVLELEDLAADIDGNLTGKIAVGD